MGGRIFRVGVILILYLFISFSVKFEINIYQEYFNNTLTKEKYYYTVYNYDFPIRKLEIECKNFDIFIDSLDFYGKIESEFNYAKLKVNYDNFILSPYSIVNKTFTYRIFIEGIEPTNVYIKLPKVYFAKLLDISGDINILEFRDKDLYYEIFGKLVGSYKYRIDFIYKSIESGLFSFPRVYVKLYSVSDLKDCKIYEYIPINIEVYKRNDRIKKNLYYEIKLTNNYNKVIKLDGFLVKVYCLPDLTLNKEFYIKFNETKVLSEKSSLYYNSSISYNCSDAINLEVKPIFNLTESYRINKTISLYTTIIPIRILGKKDLCPLNLLYPREINMIEGETTVQTIYFEIKRGIINLTSINLNLDTSSSYVKVYPNKIYNVKLNKDVVSLNIRVSSFHSGNYYLYIYDNNGFCSFLIRVNVKKVLEIKSSSNLLLINKKIEKIDRNTYKVLISVKNLGDREVKFELLEKIKGNLVNQRGFIIINKNLLKTRTITLRKGEEVNLMYTVKGGVSFENPEVVGENIIPKFFSEYKEIEIKAAMPNILDIIKYLLQIILAVLIIYRLYLTIV